MLNIGGAELLVILLVALIFLGPARLPQVARQIGQTAATLRSLASGFQSEIAAAARMEQADGPSDPVLKAVDAAFMPVIVPKTVAKTDPSDVARSAHSFGNEERPAAHDVSIGGPEDLRDEEE